MRYETKQIHQNIDVLFLFNFAFYRAVLYYSLIGRSVTSAEE